MELRSFTPQYLSAAAELFVHKFSRLRQSIPVLPATLEDVVLILHKIHGLLDEQSGVVALEDGRLIGYMSYMILDNFRQSAPHNLRLFAFGVGYDVDTYLLDSIAQENHGASSAMRSL